MGYLALGGEGGTKGGLGTFMFSFFFSCTLVSQLP